jgi:glutamate racemase
MHNKKKPSLQSIGMFDSGLGGLTVMQQVMRILPNEKIIYFGDTARVPYGSKSSETIVRYSIENAIFLMEKNIKVLVIACSTASACAMDKLQQIFNIPVIGAIEPGVERALEVTKNGRIAVLGTKATINSGIYQREIQRHRPDAFVKAIACPLFVPLVEERFASHPVAKLIVKEYLASLHQENIDTIVLGCTHYPLLHQLIKEELGDGVTIVDSAITCAEKVDAVLETHQIYSEHTEEQQKHHQYFVSDDPEKFRALGQEFLGMPLERVEAASLFTS